MAINELIYSFICSLLNRVSVGCHLNRACPRICPRRWLAGCSSLRQCPGIPQEVEAFGAGNQSCASLWPPVRVCWYCHEGYTVVSVCISWLTCIFMAQLHAWCSIYVNYSYLYKKYKLNKTMVYECGNHSAPWY